MTRAEGVGFARAHGCLFLEVSAKSRQGVQEAFAELVQRVRLVGGAHARAHARAAETHALRRPQIAESPTLLESGAATGSRVQVGAPSGGSLASACSC